MVGQNNTQTVAYTSLPEIGCPNLLKSFAMSPLYSLSLCLRPDMFPDIPECVVRSTRTYLALELVQVLDCLDLIVVAVIDSLCNLRAVQSTRTPVEISVPARGARSGRRCVLGSVPGPDKEATRQRGTNLLLCEALHFDAERAVRPSPAACCGSAGHSFASGRASASPCWVFTCGK